MKIKKSIIMFIFILIFSLSFSHALVDLQNGLVFYMDFDNYINDSSSSPVACTNNGVTFVSGKLNEAGDFESTQSDIISCADSAKLQVTTTATFGFWASFESLSGRMRIIAKNDNSPTSGYAVDLETGVAECASGHCLCLVAEGLERECYSQALSTGATLTHYVVVKNTTHVKWYVNGTLKETDAFASARTFSTDTAPLVLGRNGGSSSEYYDGVLDELFIYNNMATSETITELYNSNTGCNPITNQYGCSSNETFTAGNLTITAKNGYNNGAVSTFNATVSQGSVVNNYMTTTGTIIAPINTTYKANVTIYYPNFLNVWEVSNYNITTALTGYLWEAQINMFSYEWLSGTTITGVTYYNGVTSNTTGKMYFNDGNYNLSATKTLYQPARLNIVVSELDNKSVNFTFYKYLNVSAINGKNGDRISGLNITFKSINYSYTIQNYTTGNQFLYPVIAGIYNVTLYNNSFAQNIGTSKIIKINSSSYATTNLIFTLYTTNSFDITFKDEQSLQTIVGNKIFVDLLSSLYSANYSTTDGTLYADLLTPGTYTIRYYGTGYQPRLSTYTLTDETYNQITLYLLQSSQNVTLYVLDDTRQPVENAQIKIYRYSVVDNAYILVNTINTDYEGKAIVDVQKNSEFYRFYIYVNNQLKLSTQPAYITSSEIVFTISTATPILEHFFKSQNDYVYSCNYNVNSRNFRFYYDTAGEASRGCLYLYKLTPSSNTLYNSTCISSSTSTILLTAGNISGTTYTAKGYITVGGQDYLICTTAYNFVNNSFDKKVGSFLVILLVILFTFVAYWSMALAFVLVPVPLIFGSALGIIAVPMVASVGMLVLGIALAIIVRQRFS